MTFEDAVWIGLGLKIDEDNDVQPPSRVICPDCRADYLASNWQDEASCKFCYSSNVRIIARKEN